MSSISGMAASIRAATESETFDLAGNSTSTIQTTIKSAFSTSFNLDTMIRITFITGAGKLGRSRYDDNAAKTVTSTLRDLGFEEDRGASCVVECAGSFKSQHDTGKNLKTIVVFPNIEDIQSGIDHLNLDDENRGPAVLEEGTPKHLIAMSSANVFQGGVKSKCPAWSQKKAMVGVIGEIKQIVDSLDQKLLKGTPLTESEQDFYDTCDLSSLNAKETYVKSEMSKQVDDMRITSLEKKKLLRQVGDKLQNLKEELNDAQKNKKPKKVEKLKLQLDKLKEREKTLENITPCAPPALRYQSEIDKLRKEMQPLLKMEKETKGRLLSVKETKIMARKDEIEEEIKDCEEESRGWFEEDDDFQHRVDASRARGKTSAQKKTAKKSAGAGSGGTRSNGGAAKKTVTNWIVPGTAKRKVTRPTAKKSNAASNAFAAMMDSDSDSD